MYQSITTKQYKKFMNLWMLYGGIFIFLGVISLVVLSGILRLILIILSVVLLGVSITMILLTKNKKSKFFEISKENSILKGYIKDKESAFGGYYKLVVSYKDKIYKTEAYFTKKDTLNLMNSDVTFVLNKDETIFLLNLDK